MTRWHTYNQRRKRKLKPGLRFVKLRVRRGWVKTARDQLVWEFVQRAVDLLANDRS